MTPRRTLLAASLAGLAIPARAAEDITAGSLTISHGWTRAAGANATGAGFMTIRNTGPQPDRLLSAATPIARSVELHTSFRDGDVMRMRPVPNIEIPPGQTVELRPGGNHIMLIGLAEPLRQGSAITLTLTFERAGETRVPLDVLAAGARGMQH